jgi:hypothetical protein
VPRGRPDVLRGPAEVRGGSAEVRMKRGGEAQNLGFM